jgi:hypothetical protein
MVKNRYEGFIYFTITIISLVCANAFANERSTLSLYKSLDSAQNHAVCPVAANMRSPKDLISLGEYLIKFRDIKNVPTLIPGSLLLGLEEN